MQTLFQTKDLISLLMICKIPEDIQKNVYDYDEAKFESLCDILTQFRSDEATYLKLSSAMIHLEEAEDAKSLRKFDLKNIEMVPYSEAINMFKINFEVSSVFIETFI